METSSDTVYLTRQEAAAYLRRSVRSIDIFVRERKLVPSRIDKKLLFARHELDKFVAQHRLASEEHTVCGSAVASSEPHAPSRGDGLGRGS